MTEEGGEGPAQRRGQNLTAARTEDAARDRTRTSLLRLARGGVPASSGWKGLARVHGKDARRAVGRCGEGERE